MADDKSFQDYATTGLEEGTAEPPVDPSKDKIGTPSDPNVPSDSPIKAEPLETQEEKNQHAIEVEQSAVDEQMKIWRESHKRMEESHDQYREMRRQYFAEMQAPDAPPPAPIPLPQRPMEERKAGTFLQYALPAALMLGVGILGARGKHGGLFLNNFLGSAFSAYAQGREEESRKRQNEWWKNVQYVKDENQLRHQQYQEALANKRWNLQQKMDVWRTLGQVNGDERAVEIAERQDLKAAQQHLDQQKKAINRYSRDLTNAKLKAGMLTRDSAHRDWWDVLRNMYYNRTGIRISEDPTKMTGEQTDEMDQLMKEYPFEKFRAERKNEGKTDPATGKPEPVPGESDKDKAWQKHLDDTYGTVK